MVEQVAALNTLNSTEFIKQAHQISQIEKTNERSQNAATFAASAATQFNPNLQTIFYNACLEANRAYHQAFAHKKSNSELASEEYSQANNNAGQVAIEHLPEALSEASISITAEELANKINFRMALRLAQKIAGDTQELKNITDEEIQKRLRIEINPNDYFYVEIDNLIISHDEQNEELDKAAEVAIRLANATWLSTQIHRSVWEGTSDRINPNKKRNFDIYDNMIRNIADEDGILAAAFEIYKDMLQFK